MIQLEPDTSDALLHGYDPELPRRAGDGNERCCVIRGIVAASIVGILFPVLLTAQPATRRRIEPLQLPRCAPVTADRGAAFTFGRVGGNIRPRSFSVYADGRITVATGDAARDSVDTIPAAAVAGLARLARSGGFWELRPSAVRRTPRNPDFAREFIEVTLTCGRKRAEFASDAEPVAFSELFALLSAVARSR